MSSSARSRKEWARRSALTEPTAFDPLVKQRVGHFSCKLLENQDPFGQDELAIATRMKNLAQQDAERFGDINKRIIDGVDLEHAFNELARIVIHRALPYNDASVFEQSFTLPQRRFLFYLLSSLFRIYNRRHRKTTAAYGTD